MQQNNIYDRPFRGNVLIAGKPRCGKTYFMQKLVINNFFWEYCKNEMGIIYSANSNKGSGNSI